MLKNLVSTINLDHLYSCHFFLNLNLDCCVIRQVVTDARGVVEVHFASLLQVELLHNYADIKNHQYLLERNLRGHVEHANANKVENPSWFHIDRCYKLLQPFHPNYLHTVAVCDGF